MQESFNKIVDHLFRHESGKMVAVLTKLLGLQSLQVAQDIAQDTLLQAMHTWGRRGVPDNPPAWLYRVAKNKAIDYLRRQKRFEGVRAQHAMLLEQDQREASSVPYFFETHEIEDSQLRMIFACCHPSIPVESQIALALKTLCGLSVAEIARAFLKTEDIIAKRIYRAKEKIRTENISLALPARDEITGRLDAVLQCLYLLFNEGYNSSQSDELIREELCEEAMRMAYLLTQAELTNKPRTNAILALFCFQASRLKARLDDSGNIILLRQQDRSKWYQPLIKKGNYFLDLASEKESSVYHLEAAIAYLHAKSPSFEETDWKAIYLLYTILDKEQPSPIISLNKGIAALYAKDAETALLELKKINGLEGHYLYHTAVGEVYFELNQKKEAASYYQKALALTRAGAEQQLLREKIRSCSVPTELPVAEP